MNILPLLVERGLVDESDIAEIQEEVKKTGETLESILLKRGLDTKDILAAKGEQLNIPTKQLGEREVPFEVLQYISEDAAQHYHFVPLGVEEGVLEVGIVDPDNIEALDALNFISQKIGMPFKVYLITEDDFQQVFRHYKGMSGEVGRALNALETELAVEDEQAAVDLNKQDEKASKRKQQVQEDAPVTKIVATLIRNAVEGEASDIHIEHTGEKVRVRYRVDGILHTSIILPPKVHRAVVSRIKILASLKLDEKRKPQDGRFSATIEGRKIDFRVSTFPAHYGEKVVMRILDTQRGIDTLESVGLSPRNIEMVRDAIKKPYGLILITGPTGSGKSTTLYSMLSELDRDSKNVISLEDPVEYNVDGVAQSQMRPEIGYTFASGLRSVLRQDPDIIMVGEIRDKETARLAVQAALTGHLVLSTLHTNNAIGAIPRLIDMEVDPYLIAPTLELVIAQRLVRKLCDGTGRKIPIEGSIKTMIDDQFKDLPDKYRNEIPDVQELYGIQPTGACPSGTRGRTGAFEMFSITQKLEQAILKGSDENTFYEIAREDGMLTMKEDAIIKAFNKVIPFEEVNTLGGDFVFENEVPVDEQKPAENEVAV